MHVRHNVINSVFNFILNLHNGIMLILEDSYDIIALRIANKYYKTEMISISKVGKEQWCFVVNQECIFLTNYGKKYPIVSNS